MRSKTGVCVGAAVLVVLVAACSTDPEIDPGTDAGTTPTEEGGALPDASNPTDSAVDTGPPPPPCSRLTTLCKEGEKCEGALDCVSKICREGKCAAAAPADGTKNGDETDVDCGGSKAPACADGKGCLVAADCTSGVCTGGKCQVPNDTDGVKNGDETGKDCGGSSTKKCPTGEGCKITDDCDKVLCDATTKKCKVAAHDDGIKNLDETGIDCGGPTATVARCPTGQGCNATSDCNNVLCNGGAGAGTCDAPSSTDGLKNGTETDVDCGGGAPTNANPCAAGLACTVAADCASKGCNHKSQCAQARSCVNQYGGTTCGRGEVGQAGAAHEDCCTSVPLPGGTMRMDKYEITAGRMRTFIAAVGNNVRSWVDAAEAAAPGSIDPNLLAMKDYLPESLTAPTRSITRCDDAGGNCTTQNQRFGVYAHLGMEVFMRDRPCANCGQGCWIGNGADQIGHNTYYWPNATQSAQWGAANRAFDQQTLDVKSLNCVAEILLAAFCAWDGGRLPTHAELGANSASSAWGNTSYPWGTASPGDTLPGAPAAPVRVRYGDFNGYPGDGDFLVRMPVSGYAAAIQWNVTNYNQNYHPSWPTVRYTWPVIAVSTNDTAYLIAAPGRFTNDYRDVGGGGEGYYDVGGNLLEATSDNSGTDDANHNGWMRTRWVGGSFEGHPVGRANHNLSVLTKYGKMGGRCVRPL